MASSRAEPSVAEHLAAPIAALDPAFLPQSIRRKCEDLLIDLRWVLETLAFKRYPCGTMIHPYIDCARRLAMRGVRADEIEALVCDVALRG